MTGSIDADDGENGGDDEGTVEPQPHHGRPLSRWHGCRIRAAGAQEAGGARPAEPAAAALIRERGLHHLLVEDIVERVGVSRRTFSNYFANKEEAIVDRHLQRAEDTARILRERPPGEPLWAALTVAFLEPFAASGTHDQSPSDDDREALGAGAARTRAAGRDRSGLEGRDRGACLGHR